MVSIPRRGEISPVMWIVLGTIVLLSVLVVVIIKSGQMSKLGTFLGGLMG